MKTTVLSIAIGLGASTALISSIASALPSASVEPRQSRSELRHEIIYKGKVVAPTGTSRKSVVRITTGSSECTATLITDSSFVTAAHCVTERESEFGFETFLPDGEAEWFSPGEYVINSLSYSESSSSRSYYDLAVITVSRDRIPAGLEPMVIASSAIAGHLKTGSPIFMIGAGTVGTIIRSTDLRFAQGTIDFYQSSLIWVRGNGIQGICGGDSGGPLTVQVKGRHYIVGVLAEYRTDIDDRPGNYCTPGGVYNMISAQNYDWLMERISEADAELGN